MSFPQGHVTFNEKEKSMLANRLQITYNLRAWNEQNQLNPCFKVINGTKCSFLKDMMENENVKKKNEKKENEDREIQANSMRSWKCWDLK